MAYKEIYDELKAKLTDDKAANETMLRKEVERFIKEENREGIDAAGALIMENMPEEKRNEIIRITHIDGERMDNIYKKVDEYLNAKNINEAKKLAEKLYKKITVEFKEGEKAKFVSLRNPFEDELYQFLYKPEKTLNRTPFDFCQYISTYAYILVETGDPLTAIPVLEQAQEFNPVDVGPKFEMAEIYKLIHNKARLIEVSRETMKVASSPVAIARIYANVGYILTEFGEYEDALAFYTASAMMAPSPVIPREMQHLADLKGSPVTYIGKDKVKEILEDKYDIHFGPDPDVIRVASELAAVFIKNQDLPNALQALKLTYNLTLDENIKKMIFKYDPTAAMQFAEEEKRINEIKKKNQAENNNANE